MFDPQEEVQRAQTQLYWERNSFLTFVVLTVASLLALVLQPLGWPLWVSAVVGGVLVHLGLRSKKYWGAAVVIVGLMLPVWPVYALAASRGLVWLHIVAPLMATSLGLDFLRKRREKLK